MSMDSTFLVVKELSCVSKDSMTVRIGRTIVEYPGVFGVKIMENFFRKDGCNKCGRCCVNEETVWTESAIKPFLQEYKESATHTDVETELFNSLLRQKIWVNGNVHYMYKSRKKKNPQVATFANNERDPQPRCRWLDLGEDNEIGYHECSCLIHKWRSATCHVPHIRLSQSNAMGRLSVTQYGRNWQLHCPVEFEYVIDEQDIQTKIETLKLLQVYANDLGIETYLPEIIQYLEGGGRKPVTIE